MTGSVQLKKGYWYTVLFDSDAPKGKKYKWASTGLPEKNNKRRAEQMLKERLAEYEAVGTLISSGSLFSDVVKDWLEVAETTVRSNTYAVYMDTANLHVIPYFAKFKLTVCDIKPMHLQKYFKAKHKGTDNVKGLSANTLAKHKTVLNETFKYAIKNKLVKDNPMISVQCPTQTEYVAKYYDAGQLKELFAKTDYSIINPVIQLAGTYGLRRSEVLALSWGTVDFKERTILVSKAIVKVGTKNEERDILKSKKSRRTMPLTDEMARFLKELKSRQSANKLLLGSAYKDNDFICVREDGTPLNPDYVSHEFRRLLQANGLPHIRFHDLRHSSASLLINMGFTLREVQEWLGHSRIESTNRYAHLEYKSKQRMANRVDEALSNAGAI